MSCDAICPLLATKRFIRKFNLSAVDPLFMYYGHGEKVILNAFKVRNVLTKAIRSMGLDPKDYGFHCFRRSEANLALEMKVPLEHIKMHGHWKSEAIMSYLKVSPKMSGLVAQTFQWHITETVSYHLHFGLVLFI